MRRKRIKTTKDSKELDSFYRTIIRLKSPKKGLKPIVLTKDAFYLIARTVRIVQENNFKPKYNVPDYAMILGLVWEGGNINELNIGHYNRGVLIYLREALDVLNINYKVYRITLHTIYTSGRLYRNSKKYGFDLEYECIYYEVPIMSILEKY
jgi:hypothetical protein